MIGIFLFQLAEQNVNGIFVFLVILADFHGVDHFDQRVEVALFGGGFEVYVTDQGGVEQGFRLDPEIISAFSFALRVGYQASDQLQNVLF